MPIIGLLSTGVKVVLTAATAAIFTIDASRAGGVSGLKVRAAAGFERSDPPFGHSPQPLLTAYTASRFCQDLGPKDSVCVNTDSTVNTAFVVDKAPIIGYMVGAAPSHTHTPSPALSLSHALALPTLR